MFKRKTTSARIDAAVTRSVNFELTIADLARRSERRAWWVASAAVVLALILTGGYFYMLPLKEKIPFLVMADAATGVATVARLTDDVSLQRITASEAINRSNVAHFVLAREAYDIAFLALNDWNTVLTMSAPGVAAAYTGLYSGQNPDNPYKTYGRERAIRIHILSIVLIGGGVGNNPYRGATVRFQRTIYNKENGGSTPLDNRIATIEFTYKPTLRMDEQARLNNPLGFQVTSYRTDSDFASPTPAEFPAAAAAAPASAPASADSSLTVPPPPIANPAPVAQPASPPPAAQPAPRRRHKPRPARAGTTGTHNP